MRIAPVLVALGALCTSVPALAVPVASVQRGSFSLPATSSGPASTTRTTVTINPVDLSSSLLTFTYAVDSANPLDGHVRATLEDATTVSFERSGGGTAVSGFFSVVQFASGALVQRGVDEVPAQLTKTLSTIDPAKSFVLLSWQGTGSEYGADDFFTGQITGATSLVLTNTAYNNPGKKVSWQVVQLSDVKVQRGVATIGATSSSTTATLNPAIVTNKSFPLLSWRTDNWGTGANFPTATFGNTTTLNISRKAPGTTLAPITLTVAWEVVESTDTGVSVQAVAPSLAASGGNSLSTSQSITNAALGRSLTILPTMGGRGGGADGVGINTDAIGTTMVSIEKTAQNSLTLTRAVAGSVTDLNLYEVLFPSAIDVGLTATASASTVTAGASVTWTVNVFGGSAAAGALTVVVDLPAGIGTPSFGSGWSCTYAGGAAPKATCTKASLAADGTSTLTLTATAPKEGGSYSATATITTSGDTVAANNTATVPLTVTPSADLALAMSIVQAPPYLETKQITYSLQLANNGPSTANGVAIVDTIPAGATLDSATGTGWACGALTSGKVTCQHAAMAGGASDTLLITVTIPAGTTSAVNSATATATEADPTPADATQTLTTTITPAAALKVAVVGAPDPVDAGQKVTFTATLTNDGPSTASTVTFHFFPRVNETSKPSTFTCANGTNSLGNTRVCTGSLGVGAANAGVFTFDVTAPTDAVSTTTPPTVDASVTASAPNDLNTGASASASVDVRLVADVSVVKTASKAKYLVGDPIPYTLAVANAGPSKSGPLTLTDTLPAGVTFTSATGAGWTCAEASGVVTCTHAGLNSGANSPVTLTVGSPALQQLGLSNTAAVAVASPVNDPTSTNNTSSVVVDVNASADVGVTLAASAATVAAGDSVGLTVTAKNLGPNTATNAKVTVTLPSGVTAPAVPPAGCTVKSATSIECVAATLTTATPSVWNLQLTAPGVAADTNLVFNAAIAAAETDTKAGNDTASATVKVTPVADVGVTLTVSPNPARLSEGLTYKVAVDNKGPSPVTGRAVELALDAGLTNVVASGTGWTCTLAAATVSCTRTSFAVGAQPDITITAKAPSTAGTLAATVQAKTTGASAPDPVAANDQATANVVVGAPVLDVPGTNLAVSPAGEAKAGSRLDYTLTIANTGQVPADNVAVKLDLPEGASLVAGSLTIPGAVPGTLAVGTIAPATQKTFSFAFEVLRDNPGQIAVVAKISADQVAEFSRSVTTPIVTEKLLGLTLSAEPTELTNGQPTILTATLSGGFVPDSSQLVLTLPEGMAAKGTTAKVGDQDATLAVDGAKVSIPLNKTDAELAVKVELYATDAAEGPQTVTAVAVRKDKPVSVDGSADFNVTAAYDLGGCGCSASGSPAALLLALFGGLALLKRRARA